MEPTINNVLTLKKSSKSIGKYEKAIMARLGPYFQKLGYEVHTHIRLNIAWSNGLSDVDMLLYKDGMISIVEIKSKQDKYDSLKDQFNRMSDYVDFFYLATDKNLVNVELSDIGIIHINEEIKEIRKPILLRKKPKKSSLFALKKICLMKMSGIENKKIIKSKIVEKILSNMDETMIKAMVKEIATCNSKYHVDCPILKYVDSEETKLEFQIEQFL